MAGRQQNKPNQWRSMWPVKQLLSRRQLLRTAAKTAGLSAAASFLPLPLGTSYAEGREMHSPLKYAICNETFGDWPLEKAFAFAAKCGYRGIEIAPFTIADNVTDISEKRRTEVRRLAEKAGLTVVGLHWLLAKTKGLHLTSGETDVRRKTADYLGHLARFSADLGGRIMVLGSPQQRSLAVGMTKAEGMKHAADVLRAALPALEKADVTIAMEPLTPAETNFLNTAADAVALMEMVGSPRCRLHLDCKAMATEGEKGTGPISRNGPKAGTDAQRWSGQKSDLSPFPQVIPDLIRKYRNLFVHFHANDPNRQGPGFGKLDFVPILKTLREIDYAGWVSVEVFDYTPGPERLARESIEYLRRCAAKQQQIHSAP
jgi:sugar phosphate isomerase/epimerase